MNRKPGEFCLVLPPKTGHCRMTGYFAEIIEPLQDIHEYPDIGLVKHIVRAAHDEWLCKFIGPEKELVGIPPDVIYTSYGRMWDHRLKPIDAGESPEESAEAMRRLTSTKSEVPA